MLRSVCVDFDRVIHSYTTPWSGTTNIPDPPNKGAFQWLTEMVQHYDVHVFSARCQDVHGVSAIKLWMRKHGLSEEVIAKLQFPLGKQSAILYIDDRAFQFQGRFPTPEEIKAFKPWHPEDVPEGERAALARGVINQCRAGALSELLEELRKTITGAMVVNEIRHLSMAHLDVEDRLESLGRELVATATDSPDAPLASYSGEFTMPDGRVYRCSIEHVTS